MIAEATTERQTPTLRLYQFKAEYEALGSLLEESQGEITPEIEALWDTLGGEFSEKVDGYCGLIANFSRSAEAAKAEAKRLTDRAKSWETAADRLKERLQFHLVDLDIQKQETGRFSVRLQLNPPAVNVPKTLDPFTLPETFRVTKYEADKTALRDAWKAGLALPEGVTVTQGISLRIK